MEQDYKTWDKSQYMKEYHKNARGNFDSKVRILWNGMVGRSKLYNREICSRCDFEKLAYSSIYLRELFDLWVKSDFDKKQSPSVDRINYKLGYEIHNIQFLTKSENCRKGVEERHYRSFKKTVAIKGTTKIVTKSRTEMANKIGCAISTVSDSITNGWPVFGWKVFEGEAK